MTVAEYEPGTGFPGVVGRTYDQSSPAWPEPVRTRPGTPNIVFIVLDDTGFGHLGCYGSPIQTPNLDKLAAGGLRYNNMHTTALCSPTRACILTGRNHHSNHMAGVTGIATGFPGYDAVVPFENGFLSEMLLPHGYNTFAVGKWHLTPSTQMGAAGPFNRWPLGRGFERYYGFLGGETHQYYPALVHDNHQVDPPRTPEEGYTLNEDLADRAIQFITEAKQVAPDKPFFLYYCTGATHAPHHVPKEWAYRYRGLFDDGWEVLRKEVHKRQLALGVIPEGTELSPHDPDVPSWDGLSADEKRLYARMMEVFAGFLEQTDYHIGRVIDFIERIGELENTLVMAISDNGASAEGGPIGSTNENRFFNNVPESIEENLAALEKLGGPEYYNHFPWGWAWAGNTPFRRWKRETYRGGLSDPFIVHWPQRIHARGEVRTQYVHAIDILPTVLEVLDIHPPRAINGVTQVPIEGVSFAHSFHHAQARSRRSTQYYEMLAHRSLYHAGWKAVCPWPGSSFVQSGRAFGTPMTAEDLKALDTNGWELYHVAEDFTECHDVAGVYPERVREMVSMWYVEAGRYNVLPLDGRGVERFAEPRPQYSRQRTRYVYYPDAQPVRSGSVDVLNRPHRITANVEVPPGGAEGVLLAHGGIDGGYTLFVQSGRLHYIYNYVGSRQYQCISTEVVPEGTVRLGCEFEALGEPDVSAGKGVPGRVRLLIDGKSVGGITIPVTIPLMLGLGGGLAAGRDCGSPVTNAYAPPFAFTGTLYNVTVDVSGEPFNDDEAAARSAMARQ